MSANMRTERSFASGLSEAWRWGLLLILGTWLGASLLLDVVIMPGLYGAGMMASGNFVMAGDLIFERFNHIELLAGAMVLSSCLLARAQGQFGVWAQGRRVVAIALLLLIIPLIYTYGLTPQMMALGFRNALESSSSVPAAMDQLHGLYWSLELLKIGGAAFLLSRLRGGSAEQATS